MTTSAITHKPLLTRLFERHQNNAAKAVQLRYLSQSILLEEARAPHLVGGTLLFISVGFMLFLGWATITNISEVTRAPGEVIPVGYVQVVQHLEGGIISKLTVQEGDIVEEGQILAKFDGVGAGADLNELQARHTALALQAVRLRAFAERQQPVFKDFEQSLIAEQQKIFSSQQKARTAEESVLQEQLARKRERLREVIARQQNIQQGLALAKESRDGRKTLLDKGLANRFTYLQAQQEYNRLLGDYRSATSERRQSAQEVEEFERRLTALKAQYRNDAYQQLNAVETELASITQQINKYSNRVNRLEVRSPVRGIVKGLEFNTIGSVVKPGETMMEVVPLDEKLVVEIRIAPSDIGHVEPGQPVRVKVSSYDFARYGIIDGTIKSLSATTFVTPENISYYRGRIELSKNYVGHVPEQNLVLPGMTVEADVVTGEKSILAYLLKPIQTSLNQAFTER